MDHPTISEEDLEIIEQACLGAPSKQNVTFFKSYFIQDRDTIEAIHKHTSGFYIQDGVKGGKALKGNRLTTNIQTLANLLIVFVKDFDATQAAQNTDQWHNESLMEQDMHQAVGVAAGYVNMTAAMLGYSTGCCSCCNKDEIQRILNIEEKPLLLMGVGYPDKSKPRRQHHLKEELVFHPIKRLN